MKRAQRAPEAHRPTAALSAYAESLRRVPIFATADEAALAALAQRAQARAYASGDILFQEGDVCGGVYVLTAGEVRIFKLSVSGRELTLHRETAPATVAEVPLVDGGPYPASVQAVNDVATLYLPRADFLAVCLQHPQVAVEALRLFGSRLRNLVSLLEAVTFGGVRQRLARLLLDGARRGEDGRSILSGTHQEFALGLGTVREVISRNLSRFQADGLIRLGHREIEILDESRLRHEAEIEL